MLKPVKRKSFQDKSYWYLLAIHSETTEEEKKKSKKIKALKKTNKQQEKTTPFGLPKSLHLFFCYTERIHYIT